MNFKNLVRQKDVKKGRTFCDTLILLSMYVLKKINLWKNEIWKIISVIIPVKYSRWMFGCWTKDKNQNNIFESHGFLIVIIACRLGERDFGIVTKNFQTFISIKENISSFLLNYFRAGPNLCFILLLYLLHLDYCISVILLWIR